MAVQNRITFHHAGLSPVKEKGGLMKQQLQHFYFSLQLHGMKKSHRPESRL